MPGRSSLRWNTGSGVARVSAWNGLNALANPSLAGWPDSTNTGVRTGLTPSGSVSSSSNGQLISGLDVTGTITVTHTGVTVRDCQVTCGSFVAIQCSSGTNVTVEYCDVIGGAGDNLTGVEASDGGLVQYCDIRGFENSIKLRCEAATAQHNYGHGFDAPGVDPHYDGIEVYGGDDHVIHHNTIILDQIDTSAINMTPEFGGDNWVCSSNLITGGGWIINYDEQGGTLTNHSLINNRFGLTFQFGYAPLDWPTVTSGNVRDDTGANIDSEL